MKNLIVVTCLVVSACGSKPPRSFATPATAHAAAAKQDASKTLFARLGGKPAIEAVVNEFVNRTTTDDRIKERFFNTNATMLKQLLVEFVCVATGGPCKYSGRTMETSHAGMELVDEEFTALVEDLAGALDKFNVPAKEKGELLGALGPLKPTMVVAPGKLKPIAAAKLAQVTALAKSVKDEAAVGLLTAAVVAGQRGQRSYAEQLFSRAELLVGAKALASVATTFRVGAPPRLMTELKSMPKDSPRQPATSVGRSDDDAPADKKPASASLKGSLTIAGSPVTGFGVVMLTPVTGGAKRTAKQRVIEQREKTFAPHVMAVPVGSTVAFPNFDSIYHNVFSVSARKAFDLGLYKNGDMREVTFDKPGIVRLGCNIHASMSAYVIVVDAPHYAVVDDGTFSFRSLAPGAYMVSAWTEQSGEPMVSKLVIKAGTNTLPLDFKAKVAAAPGPDKFGGSRTE